jgi:integrase/recombinase XerD
MRDLYNRQARLKYWIGRIDEDLEGQDREDVHRLVTIMQDRELASLWIMRCITALISLRRQLKKPFDDATKEDIRGLLKWMDEKGYKASSQEKYRQILKLFYKNIYGNGEEYPDNVKWFSSKLSKEKRGARTNMDMAEFLEEAEVNFVVNTASTVQRKAFLAGLYESGARPEEYLRLTNRDIRVETDGIAVMLRGKTGERWVKIIVYAKLLLQWLDIHPLKEEPEYCLWISEATNFKNKPLGIRGAEKIMEQTMADTDLKNKHARLYIMRHSRATYLAKRGMAEAQLCHYMGWVLGSKVVQRYVHLSGRDLDATLLAISEGDTPRPQETLLRTRKCIRCSEALSPANNFCPKCALPVTLTEQYLAEAEGERKAKENELKLQQLQEQNAKLQADFQALASVIGSLNQSSRNDLAKIMYQKGVYRIQQNENSVTA